MLETTATPNTPVPPPSARNWVKPLLMVTPYVVLYLIAIWLVAITDSEPERVGNLWQWFIPAIGLVATYGGWQRMRASGEGPTAYLIKQVLHWVATLAVVLLLFWPTLQIYLNAETHGFVVIYVLGLAAVLAGVHTDWKMGLFGLFLVASGVGIAFFDDNAMLMTLIGSAILGVGLSVVIRRHSHA